MGIASHDMADMVFDSLFVPVVELEDASGMSSAGPLDGFDAASDVLLVVVVIIALLLGSRCRRRGRS